MLPLWSLVAKALLHGQQYILDACHEHNVTIVNSISALSIILLGHTESFDIELKAHVTESNPLS